MRGVKKTLVTILAVAGMCLAPAAAHADEPLPPAAYDDYLPGVLDCTTATWSFVTIHYQADQTSPGEYGDWYEVSRDTETGLATGDDITADCPNWVIENKDTDPVWVNVDLPTPPAWTEPEPEPVTVGDGVLWKQGING